MTIGVKTPSGVEARARQGDGNAFGELIAQWDADLRGVVWSVVRSPADTDDVMQAAYEKAFRSITSFRGEASLKTWLHSICYRCALDHVRFEGRRRHQSDELLARRAAHSSTSDQAIARTELANVMDQLDADVRAMLMLTAGLGYTFDETAEIVALERGTVASKVGRAKAALRSQNQRQGEDAQ